MDKTGKFCIVYFMNKTERRSIIEWISRDPVRFRHMLDFYDTGGKICQIDEKALLLVKEEERLAYGAGRDIQAYPRWLYLIDDRDEMNRLLDAGILADDINPVWMVYYPSETVTGRKEIPGIRFRRLTTADSEFVRDHYDAPGANQPGVIEKCISDGMIGAEDEHGLCGFIGQHREGTIGFLFVLPSHRRRGIAQELEQEMIRHQLERMRFPYAHVLEHNERSLALQKKIGMEIYPDLYYWAAGRDF